MSEREDGIYHDIPDEEYHAIERISNSYLGILKRSPAHLIYALEHEPEEKDHFTFGRAAHDAVLRPLHFEEAWARAPEGDRRTKAVKEEWAKLEEEHGSMILKPDAYDKADALGKEVRSHVITSPILAAPGHAEVTLLWTDPETGIKCKGRVDWLPASDWSWFFDLKTTTDASAKGFAKSLFAYGYFRQMAFYKGGLEVLGDRRDQVAIIAVEKEPPFALSTFRVDEAALSAGEHEYKRLLKLYAQCASMDHWPGYEEGVVDISLPPWAWSEIPTEGEGL